METILKKTIRSGNASAVVLPKAWLNKNVKIELMDKSPEIILCDVLDILKLEIDLSEIIGVYLVGSYAREEEANISDIDVLVISENTNKETIKEGIYEIMIVSLELLNQKLKENLLPVGTMLKEAKPLLNNHFLKKIDIKVTRKNIKWYFDTTKESLKVVKDSIDMIERRKPNGKLSDAVAYSLILRLRTLYMIDCLRSNKVYIKKKFIKLIEKISGSSVAYDRYIYAKNNIKNQRKLLLSEGKKLYEYLKEYLQKISKSVK